MHDEFAAQLKRIDDATNAVAARLDKLSEQLKNGLSAEEAAQVVAQLQADADRLEVLGKDPANPVPA